MSSARGADSWSRRFAEGLYAYRRWALALGLLLAGLAVGPTVGIEVDNTLRRYMVEGDPALESYRKFQSTYGNDETVLIGLRRTGGLLTPDGLALLRTATERVRGIDGVVGVQSLTTQVLAVGFLVLGLAHNRSVVWFGLLVSGALVAALIVDLLVLPALLAEGQRNKGGSADGK